MTVRCKLCGRPIRDHRAIVRGFGWRCWTRVLSWTAEHRQEVLNGRH